MSVIIFILILAVLIIVHEYGHFIVAKKGGIRVDEFGLGYPPRARKLFRRNGTDFTLNWLPFGGFVKIFGENPDDESLNGEMKNQSFVNKPKWLQALVLFAGPFMNFAFAWLVIFATLLVGLPTTIDENFDQKFISNQTTVITQVLPDSPADLSGLKVGDKIQKISLDGQKLENISGQSLRELVLANPEAIFNIELENDGTKSYDVKPSETNGEKILGISLSEFGIYKPSFFKAFVESFRFTGVMIAGISVALFDLIKGIFVGGSAIANLTGPIGIVAIVGDASREGLSYLLSFTALISINLGLINLIPFPALDGGRLLFLGLEKIKGGRINPKILNFLNFVGFALLIILMIFVSYKDILRLI